MKSLPALKRNWHGLTPTTRSQSYPDGAPGASLARTWHWENHVTVSMALGKDRIFSNDRSVTATAICCNLERAMKETAKAIFNTGEFRIIRREEATRTLSPEGSVGPPLSPFVGAFFKRLWHRRSRLRRITSQYDRRWCFSYRNDEFQGHTPCFGRRERRFGRLAFLHRIRRSGATYSVRGG